MRLETTGDHDADVAVQTMRAALEAAAAASTEKGNTPQVSLLAQLGALSERAQRLEAEIHALRSDRDALRADRDAVAEDRALVREELEEVRAELDRLRAAEPSATSATPVTADDAARPRLRRFRRR